MEIIFGNEHLALPRWHRGVYKVIINEKWFYIGSSIDLKRRLSGWKHIIKTGNFISKNGNLKFIYSEITKVRFEILEVVPMGINPKLAEDFFIKKEFNNECCLNISSNAFCTLKNKKPYGYIPKVQKVKNPPTPRQPIAVFSKTNKFIEELPSGCALEKKYKVKHETAKKILNGERGQPRKINIMAIDSYGNYITPPVFTPKYLVNKKQPVHYPMSNKKRAIMQIDDNGIVMVHPDLKSAEIALKRSRKYIHVALRRNWKVNGYIVKYA